MEKNKIIIYTPYFYPEPFPINTFAKELSERKNIDEVLIITSLPNYRKYGYYEGYNIAGPYSENINKLKIKRVPVIPRLSNSTFSIFFFYLSFLLSSLIYLIYFGILNRGKYNHVLTFCGSPVFIGYIGFIFSKLIGSKSSLWIQDIWPEAIETTIGLKNNMIRNFILFLQNRMFTLCDILFCESESLSNYLKSRYSKKVVTLYNPIREEQIIFNHQRKEIVLNDHIEYSYIGNMGSAQNIELIVKSFLKAKILNSKLNMCGDGNLLGYLSKKYENENINWHGWIEGEKLDEIFNKTDFLVMSLNSKGRQSLIIPSKIQTYFMKKKPILCISKGACSELIKKNYCGLVCEDFQEFNVIDLYKKSLQLTNDEKETMGQNAYNFYKNNFTKEEIVNKFLKVL